jgi:hypothetical protein
MALLTINAIGRWCFDMEQSAAGDLILLLVACDGTVILQAEDFASFSRDFTAATDLRAFYLLLIVVSFALWEFAVFGIERGMRITHVAGHSFSITRAVTMMSYIGTAAVAVVLNTAAFTGHP